MRQVLVDHARRRLTAKREDAWKQVTLTDAGPAGGLSSDELIALNDALERLDPRQRRIVECRFFGGMDDIEIAAALGVTDRTVRREWVKARAYLNRALYPTEENGEPNAPKA
jgi:RNA polymerase sigma factor (TIGR02999 family)